MTIQWSPHTRTDLRAIDRETAIRILRNLARYAQTGQGDVKDLQGQYLGQRRGPREPRPGLPLSPPTAQIEVSVHAEDSDPNTPARAWFDVNISSGPNPQVTVNLLRHPPWPLTLQTHP
jgi:hypothetical protein